VSGIYVSDTEWAEWEADRETRNREYALEQRARTLREQPARIEGLHARIEELELRTLVLSEALTAATELLAEHYRPVLRRVA
jgi:hypothetical protein